MTEQGIDPLVARLEASAAECDDNAASGCNVSYVEPMKAWDDFASSSRAAAAQLRSQAERIAALTAERDEYKEVAQEFRARFVTSFGPDAVSAHEKMKAAEARLAAALAALEPFEEVACEGNEDEPDDEKCVVKAGRSTCYWLTLGDFRRARATLSRLTAEQNGGDDA